MKKLIVAVLFLLTLFPAFAQKVGEYPAIRPDHPRIMFNADTWPEVKARAEGPAKKYLTKLLKDCDAMTDDPHCERTEALNIKYGIQPDGSVISKTGTGVKGIKEFGEEAAKCALAWRFTGEEKYLQKAKKMLGESIRGYVEATKNLRPVNWWSTCRINALCAYDWIYEALTDEERSAFIIPLTEHVRLVQPEAKLGIPRQPPGSYRTGFYGVASLLWYSGLAAYGDGFCDELAKEQLEKGYDLFLGVLEHRNRTAGDDGALSTTAINYACEMYPYAHFNFFHSYLSATGRNIADNYPGMALFPYWVYWSWIRDSDTLGNTLRHCGAADTLHGDPIITLRSSTNFSNLYENLCNYVHFFKDADPQATAFTSAFTSLFTDREMTFKFPAYPFLVDCEFDVDSNLTKKLKKPEVKARHFETLGQIHMRSGWDVSSTYCTFTAGAILNQHKHYDENNFVIYKYDHLLLDTGCRANQRDFNLTHYYAQSVAHNVVLIKKPGEKLPSYWGPKSSDPADKINYGGQVNHKAAKVLAFETNETYSYVASDAAVCYGPKAKECVRQFVYIHPDCFVVYDRVGSEKASYEKDWLLHFKNEPEIKKNVITAESGGGRLYCQTFLPKDFKFDLIGGPGKEFQLGDRSYPIMPSAVKRYELNAKKIGRGPYTGAWRIEVKSGSESENVRFLNVITVGPDDMEKPVPAKYLKDATRDGVQLKVNGKKITLWFNREGEVGGSIAEGRSPEKPLATTVQPQSGAIL